MGKLKKLKVSKAKNVPLCEQLQEEEGLKPIKSKRKYVKENDIVINSELTTKILKEARKQQQELEEEHGIGDRRKVSSISLNASDSSSDSEYAENCDYAVYDDLVFSSDLQKSLENFTNCEYKGGKTLTDIIKEKISEKQTEIASDLSDRQKLYRGVRDVLSKYRSGKLPKAFKILPRLINWEQILSLTEPDKWSAAAMYQATRIFTSNMKENMAQRFFNLILLPRVRDDISYYKHLNSHLFQALHKALFKPGAFFKGILIPLCESQSCTLREAIIIGSVLAKHSIPVLHASAAMLRIAEMSYSGANSIFLRILFDKHYALPYQVIDAVVYHFLRFQHESRELPVLWHQAFLTFVQNYKKDISNEQKEALLDLCKAQKHHQITAEVRKELTASLEFAS